MPCSGVGGPGRSSFCGGDMGPGEAALADAMTDNVISALGRTQRLEVWDLVMTPGFVPVLCIVHVMPSVGACDPLAGVFKWSSGCSKSRMDVTSGAMPLKARPKTPWRSKSG